jgi:DNA-binding MarR family transcriptional regulator
VRSQSDHRNPDQRNQDDRKHEEQREQGGSANGAKTAKTAKTRTAAQAAEALADEVVRFGRLIAAWKSHSSADRSAADRVLLARLVVGGERRATDLAGEAMLDLSTVSRQVRSLVDRGLVERRPDPEDRRGTLLAATDAGRAAFDEYRRQRNEEFADLLADWPPRDRYELVRLMGRLNEDLAEQHARRCAGVSGATARQGEGQA